MATNVDFKDMNLVKNWRLKVFEQKKTEKAVIMNAAKSGKKKDDGTYEKSMGISIILNNATEWPHADLTGKNILVDGQFSHNEWEKNGRGGLDFIIFATKIQEYVYEDNNKGENKW